VSDLETYIRTGIRQAREEADLSQYDLADRFGTTQSSISGIERGRVSISAADLYRMAEILGKPITYFFPPKEPADKQLEEQLLFMFRAMPADAQQGIAAMITAQFELVRQTREIGKLPKEQQQEAAYEAFARFLYTQGVRVKIDEAGYPVLDGGDVTAVLESVDEDEMPFLIKSVKRLQELQG
jgi:transcriptional regulator with XRE-family HTH domain